MATLETFQGMLIGQAIGDGLGAHFEGQEADWIAQRLPDTSAVINYDTSELWYTDDTQMAIGVAEAICESGAIVEAVLCQKFVDNYVPARGYGRGARVILDAMESGSDYGYLAEHFFEGGSYGNGAAMRIAPVGLYFADNDALRHEQARLASWPTHRHPLGIEGAHLIAEAVALVAGDDYDAASFYATLTENCTSDIFQEKLDLAAQASKFEDLASLGNGIEATESVVTAIAAFTVSPSDYCETIANCIRLGGDTDTIAAMAGAISGTHLGLSKLPTKLIDKLERSPKGYEYLLELGQRLYNKHTTN